jgi:hypothetical protein
MSKHPSHVLSSGTFRIVKASLARFIANDPWIELSVERNASAAATVAIFRSICCVDQNTEKNQTRRCFLKVPLWSPDFPPQGRRPGQLS